MLFLISLLVDTIKTHKNRESSVFCIGVLISRFTVLFIFQCNRTDQDFHLCGCTCELSFLLTVLASFLRIRNMSDVALKSISIIIGAFFILFGILKVVPLFSTDLYHDMVSFTLQTCHKCNIHFDVFYTCLNLRLQKLKFSYLPDLLLSLIYAVRNGTLLYISSLSGSHLELNLVLIELQSSFFMRF